MGQIKCDLLDEISTHALTEGDKPARIFVQITVIFQLTPSRRATGKEAHLRHYLNISTHALTEGDSAERRIQREQLISTHALTEGDWQPGR